MPSAPEGRPGSVELAAVRAAAELTLSEGGRPARRRAAALDHVLAELVGTVPLPRSSVAVVAVGGYGRGDVSPHSDVDLLVLVDDKRRPSPEDLRGLLYPLWDAGFQVGHAVCSPKEAIERARGDLEAATSLLEARLVAGPAGLMDEMTGRRRRWLERDGRRLARRLLEVTAERHLRVERAGWVLAPDLKQDVGGLRDLHAVGWLAAVAGWPRPAGRPELVRAGELLLAVREALHGQTRRKNDRVRADLQPAVAKALGLDGDEGADRLMAAVHTSARTVEYLAAVETRTLAERLLGGPRRSGLVRHLEPGGIRLEDGLLVVDATDAGRARPPAADAGAPSGRVAQGGMEGSPLSTGDLEPAADPQAEVLLAMRLLAARAGTGRQIARPTLAWLEQTFDRTPLEAWSEPLRAAFMTVLRGPEAVGACELLDHVGGWAVLLPEWASVRGRVQHDPWHRYTVDGHAFAAAAEVSRLLEQDERAAKTAEAAGDLDALYLAAIFHDIGKGSGADHSVAGELLTRRALARMGVDADELEEVAVLVRHHLLLVETATRRDLDDPSVVEGVAAALGSPRRLRLLHLLTVADGLATGPAAWNDWKGTLVADLAARVLHVLERGGPPSPGDPEALAVRIEAARPALAGQAARLLGSLPGSYLSTLATVDAEELAEELELLADPPGPGGVRHRVDPSGDGHGLVTVCAADRPGTLARTTGVLALHRVSVLRAHVWSTSGGLALQRFAVQAPATLRWERLGADLDAAWAGRLAVEARLERKARDYRAPAPVEPDVRVLPDESAHSTVVEVRAADALGLLHAIAAALGDLDLDVRVAKIDTLGDRVVDTFYVRSPWGAKLSDEQADELTLAIRHRTTRLLGG
ncbi:MAG TPA: [protein-PII] uridylyltransferase [Actinomycetota bacterium]|nr:[protein-PII] uridylyltransferase [Actinomycetota bacterium]